MLTKQKSGHPEYDILSNVFAVLSAKSLCEATAGLVMDVADNLLDTPDFEPKDHHCSLTVNDAAFIDDKAGGSQEWESACVAGEYLKFGWCFCSRQHGYVFRLIHYINLHIIFMLRIYIVFALTAKVK